MTIVLREGSRSVHVQRDLSAEQFHTWTVNFGHLRFQGWGIIFLATRLSNLLTFSLTKSVECFCISLEFSAECTGFRKFSGVSRNSSKFREIFDKILGNSRYIFEIKCQIWSANFFKHLLKSGNSPAFSQVLRTTAIFGLGSVQKREELVDLEKCCKKNI